MPPNYKLVLENDDVLVYRVHYGPHEKIAEHDHSDFATVYVYLNDSGPVRISHDDEATPFAITRPPTHTGAFRVSPGRSERHAVENLSELPSDFLRVELKKHPVKSLPAEFRGAAPAPPYRDGTETLYANDQLRIERTLCSGGMACVLPAESSPSAVVTIPLTPGEAESSVVWVKKGDAFRPPAAEGALEILRIVLPKG